MFFSEANLTLKKEKVLVTGAGGFIGSHLVEELIRQGYSVRAFVHYNSRNSWGWIEELNSTIQDNLEMFPADIRDPFVVKKAIQGCSTVFHLAALIAIPYSYIAPGEFIETNIKGTLNILQASLEEKVNRVIHTSTSEVYGTAQYVPIDESHPLQGQSPYSASKIAADKLAESYYLSFGLPVTTIRPFNTYGPCQSARAIIPTVVTQALSEKEIVIGSLSPIRDLTYVLDTVSGFLKASQVEGSIGQVINLGSGKGISIGELVKKILNILKIDKPVIQDKKRFRPEKSEVLKLIANNKKAREVLDWKPTISFDEGLLKTINWLKQNLHFYKPKIYNK